MSPPVCAACGQILSGSFFQEGERALCAACGPKRRDSAKARRVVGFVLIGWGGAIAGLALYWFTTPRWGFTSGAGAAALAVAASLVVAWFRAPAPVDGPRPVGDTMPPPGSGRV